MSKIFFCKRKEFQNTQNMRENSNNIFLSQNHSGPRTGIVVSQRNTRNSSRTSSQLINSQNAALQNMDEEEEMQLISSVIRYLFMTDQSKQPIKKTHIIKNVLGEDVKVFRSIIEKVKTQLSEVFAYKLVEVENNKYILVNEIENNFPHLIHNNKNKQVLLFLVLVHIFMQGESCKEELLWAFLRNLDIITYNSFQHNYFGDIKKLVTIDFVNERYLSKITVKNDSSEFEYTWGSRAQNEVTYRSCLEFIGNIYGNAINHWKLQYKAMMEQEQ